MFKGSLKNAKGFSLIEMVLALFMGSLVVGVTSQSLLNNVDSYQFIANRKSALHDVRYAINRISHELLRIETSDLTSISATGIDFIDDTGANTSFTLGTNDDGLGLFRGDTLLIDNVESFDLTYYDQDGLVVEPNGDNIETMAEVKRIKVSVTTEATDSEGNITLSTLITPRAFVGYNNYQ